MASPCEILIDCTAEATARRSLQRAAAEAWRIERKYSRYRDDSVVAAVRAAGGDPLEVDGETGLLLDFADRCHRLSDGRFDITSGILRRVWRFDGSDRIPEAREVEALLPSIGWEKVEWSSPRLRVPAGMELDLGGLGKEYAVDRVSGLLLEISDAPHVVNFGGDLRVSGPRRDGEPWRIGIERPGVETRRPAPEHGCPETEAIRSLALFRGGLATSGDSRRFLERDGIRYSHILDPRTGWPVARAPRSVTVLASTCVEAGMLATFAMLRGAEAESFLAREGVQYWAVR
jgi:thiamine biosynthesis lipoprotein